MSVIRNNLSTLLVLLFTAFFFLFIGKYNVCYVKMGSVDFVFAVSTPSADPHQLQHNDYISFIFKKEGDRYVKPGMKLTKRVACLPGEHLKETRTEVYCNDHLIGIVQPRDSRGRPVKPFIYDAKVPPGKLFVLGDNLMSYDSKYFGFIDTSWITEKILFPIW